MVAILLKKLLPNQQDKNITLFDTLIAIATSVIGLIMFSYYSQGDDCIDYNDWRRKLTPAFIFVIAYGTFVYSVPLITSSFDGYKYELLYEYGLLAGMTVILIFISLNVLAYSRQSEIDFYNSPNWKMFTIIISGVLITGSLVPLMSYTGYLIINSKSSSFDLQLVDTI
jgi:hypothetical protein